MNWLIIILVIFAIFFILKIKHIRTKTFTVFALLLLLFLYFTFVNVTKELSQDIRSIEGVVTATKMYFSWLGQGFSNLKVLTANAARMNWFPQNKSLSEFKEDKGWD